MNNGSIIVAESLHIDVCHGGITEEEERALLFVAEGDGHGAVGIVFVRLEGKLVALGAVSDHIFLAGNGPRCLIIIVVLPILLG